MKRKIKYLTTLLLFVFLFYSIRGSFSRYRTEAETEEINSTNLPIAGFVVNNQITDTLEFNIYNMAPGETKEITFSVANNQNGKRSDITNYYEISLSSSTLPLQAELKDLTHNITYPYSNFCQTNYNGYRIFGLSCSINDNTNMKTSFSSNETINYKLTLTYPNTANSKNYSFMNNSDTINLTIYGFQFEY